MSLRDVAEAYRVALDLGVCTEADVVTWACTQLSEADADPLWLLDIAAYSLGGAHGAMPYPPSTLREVLTSLPGCPDTGRALAIAFHCMRQGVSAGRLS